MLCVKSFGTSEHVSPMCVGRGEVGGGAPPAGSSSEDETVDACGQKLKNGQLQSLKFAAENVGQFLALGYFSFISQELRSHKTNKRLHYTWP